MGSHIFSPTQAGNDVVGSFGPWLRDAFISIVHFVLVSFFQLLPAETDDREVSLVSPCFMNGLEAFLPGEDRMAGEPSLLGCV